MNIDTSVDQVKAAARIGKPHRIETPDQRAAEITVINDAGAEIRSFIERYEYLESEKRDIADQMKEVMAEAKGRGYDTKVLRKIIALRRRDPDDIAEEEAILEMYKAALGMR